jgi:protocatechuate 3,4-dioxygenase beta subunit
MQIQLPTKLGTVALAACLLTAAPSLSVDCACHKPEKGDSTRPGGNMMIVVPLDKTYRDLRGTVQMSDGRVLENALVEIFDNADYLIHETDGHLEQAPHQTRLAACVTGADGKFSFRDLPSGTYELRSSIKAGWNVTHIHVTVNKHSGENGSVVVHMSVGT